MNIDYDFAIAELSDNEAYLFEHHTQYRADALKKIHDLSDETDRTVSVFAHGKEIGTYDASEGEYKPVAA